MSMAYQAVGWNRQKKIYDRLLLGGVIAYLVVFFAFQFMLHPQTTAETALLRATGTGAIVLLHIILCIGPLCRLDKRFLPLLYNRRHMGVTMFALGLVHGVLAIIQFHGFSDMNPLVSLFVSDPAFHSLYRFPFQTLGFAGLFILFLMAATSHDFWLANLTAPVWKALHMLVYLAWFLLMAHVILGILQSEGGIILWGLAAFGFSLVTGLHLAAGFQERAVDKELKAGDFVDVGALADIPEKRALVVTLSGERVAVFKYDGKLSAVSNVCRHQNGPLGEGKIVDGCITCPWHGYQYEPHNGAGPPPFTEKVPTFRVKLEGERVLVHPKPHPAGTALEPAVIPREEPQTNNDEPFYIGYLPRAPASLASWLKSAIALFMVLALTAAILMVAGQKEFSPGVFEYGQVREFEGVLLAEPYPALLVKRPGQIGGAAAVSYWHLVGAGKNGLPPEVAAMDGRKVRVAGTLIYRNDQTMLEVARDGILPLGAGEPAPQMQPLGGVTLYGEIVDSKCYLGVMKPGNLETHRACAIRCIAGGIPPVLVVRDQRGYARYFLLTTPDGASFGDGLHSLIARPVAVRGFLSRRGDQLILETVLQGIEPVEATR